MQLCKEGNKNKPKEKYYDKHTKTGTSFSADGT